MYYINLSGTVRRSFEAIKTILLALARTLVDSVSLTNGKASMNMYQLFTDLSVYWISLWSQFRISWPISASVGCFAFKRRKYLSAFLSSAV